MRLPFAAMIRRNSLQTVGWGAIAAALFFAAARPATADEPAGFQSIVQNRQREMLREVAAYLDAQPSAPDAAEARSWLLETAVATGLESEVIPAAEQVLQQADVDPALRTLALQTVCVGSARTGDMAKSQAAYSSFVRGFRLQSPFRALDVAGVLAARGQLAGDVDMVRGVYETFSAAFALNSQAGEIVENRRARLDLAGRRSPGLQGTDVEGRPLTSADLAGKVVLVDFWATNCAPCLAEFPNLRRLYRRHRDRGFEIVGVSFDDGAATVAAFARQQKLEWRHLVEANPPGEIARRFQTRTIPALFLVDRQGMIAYVDVRGPELSEAVEKLLSRPPQ